MIVLHLLMGLTLAQANMPQTQSPSSVPSVSAPEVINDELRRARNEYAFGNYREAAERLTKLLYPMRLSTDEQVIEARQYLALSYYLLNQPQAMTEEFAKLLYLEPDYQLDPFSVAPSIVDKFEETRRRLRVELDAIRQRKQDAQTQEGLAPGSVRTIETTIIERSPLMTLMPFGIGQFYNGETRLGVVFAVTEAVLLGINIGSYLWSLKIGDYPARRRTRAQTLIVAQYASLALFGIVWSVGVFQARLNFVPTISEAPVITDQPVTQQSETRTRVGPGAVLTLRF